MKSVCCVYWEFLTNGPDFRDAFSDPRMRREDPADSLGFFEDAGLDNEAMLLVFPPIQVPSERMNGDATVSSL